MKIRDALPPGHAEASRRLAAWHAEWERRRLRTDAYRPDPGRPDGSDYPQHWLDVDGASPAAEDVFHNQARRILGLTQS